MNAENSNNDNVERPRYDDYDIEEVATGRVAAIVRFLWCRPSRDLAIVAAIVALCVIAGKVIDAGLALTTQGLIGAIVCAVLVVAVAVIAIRREDNAHGASQRPKDKTQASQPGRGAPDDRSDRAPP